MTDESVVRIDVDAVNALLGWKTRFAEEVAMGARRLAAEKGRAAVVTVADYREAAHGALRVLAAAILDGGTSRDEQAA